MCKLTPLHIFLLIVLLLSEVSICVSQNALEQAYPKKWLLESKKANNQGKHQQSLRYADSALNFLDQLDDQEQYELFFYRGKSLRYLDQNIKAIQSFSRGLDKASTRDERARAYFELGELYFDEKSLDIALQQYEEALKLYLESDQEKEVRKAQFKTGIVHSQLRHPDEAISLFQTVLSKGKDDLVQSALCHDELGKIYYHEAAFDSSIAHYHEANTIYRKLNFTSSLANNLGEIALIEAMRDQHAAAIANWNEAAELHLKNKDQQGAALAYTELSRAYAALEEWRNAVRMQRKALDHIPSGQVEQIAHLQIDLAKLLEKSGEMGAAELAYYDAFTYAKHHGLNRLMEKSLRYELEFLEKKGNLPGALLALKKADSLAHINAQQQISALKRSLNEQKISTETYLRESSDTRTQDENKSDRQFWNIIVIGIVCFVIIIGLLYREFSQKQKLSKVLEWKVYKRTRELRKANKELNTYIYKSSHDLRTPLTSIKSLLRLLDKEDHNAVSKKYLGLIAACSEQMDGILVNLSRAVDYKKVDIKIEQIDFNKLKFDLENKELMGKDELQLTWEIQELVPFYSDFKLLKVILNRTIANAIDYRKGTSEDYCKVSIYTDEQGATVKIEDNGLGIPEKVRDRVFEMFVKGTNKSKGAGLGLYLVKIASEKLRGKINLESFPNKGATLIFRLPNLQETKD